MTLNPYMFSPSAALVHGTALRWARAAVPLCTAVLLASQGASAQQPAAQPASQAAPAPLITVAPDSVRIEPNARTATLQLTNTTNDWATAEVRLLDAKPLTLPTSADTTQHAQHDPLRSLVSWSTGFVDGWPRQMSLIKVQLAAHETLTVTYHFKVPPKLHPGLYTGYLVVYAVPGQSPSRFFRMGGMAVEIIAPHEASEPFAAAKLVYQADPNSTRRP